MSSSDSNADSDDDVGEVEAAENGQNGKRKVNPFFGKRKREEEEEQEESDSSELTDDSDDEDEEGEDADSDNEDEEDKKEEEDDGEDDLIKKLKKAKESKERNAPPDIRLRDLLVDLSMHPNRDLVAGSTMDGDIKLFSYSNEKNQLQKSLRIHKKDARTIEFDDDGKRLYTGSLDKAIKITDMETFKVTHKLLNAHDSPLYKVRPISQHLFASGDEDGGVRLWDHRRSADTPVMDLKPFDDFVSDFHVDDEGKIMIAASGEGLLQSFNLRGRRADTQSEVYEGEMNCLDVVRRGSKLVAGCGDGTLYLFNWGEFAYHSYQFPGHPDAVNHMVAATDNVVITACEDGSIRAVHLYPHRFVGAIGHHEKGFGVERLDVSGDGSLVASISHDQKIKFWNIAYLESMDYNKTKKPFNNRVKYKIRRKENKMNLAKEKEFQLPSSNKSNRKDFFTDL